MYLARAILGLCCVVSGCNVILQGPGTETGTDGESTTSETDSTSESITSGATASPEPTTMASTTTASETSGGTTEAIEMTEPGGSTDTSTSGEEATSAGSSESGSPESSTTDPDGHPLEGTYEGTMAADCVVGLLSGVLEFDVDDSGEVDGEAAVSFGAGGPIVAPVMGSVDESGAIEATATIGGGAGSCEVTGTLFESGTGSGVFTCPTLACDGTWITN